ncbi:hypothetical protein H4S02_003846 [Coemansia sp. RSA 2611]|nr:hypothetical protein H4S02_003846 [Coemansia sp. RSA 2611]
MPAKPWRPTQHEMRTYNYLFSLLDSHNAGIVSASSVHGLLHRSGLHAFQTQAIWQLAAGAAATQVYKRQFYLAMKLVALAQSGRPVAVSNLGEFTSLPVFAGVNKSTGNKQHAGERSSVLRYAPQLTIDADTIRKTVDLDDIISSAQGSASDSTLTPAVTPPRSPTSTIMYLDGFEPADNNYDDTLSMLTPELCHLAPSPLSPPSSSSPPARMMPYELQINTQLARSVHSESSDNASDSQTAHTMDERTPLSTDSITELLARIDLMIPSSTHPATQSQHRGSLESQLHSATELRSELESKIAELQEQCDREQSQNRQLVDRLSSEESHIKSLTAQVSRAQMHIAYVARQRAQLVNRLQRVEGQQQEMRGRLQMAESASGQCYDEVGQLDTKVFGMERNMVRMQRHARFQQARQAQGPASCPKPSPQNSVLSRYQTAKRNRLSSVFRKPAMA